MEGIDPSALSPSGALLPTLTGLALLDSLSLGTLTIPVWLMLAPGRIRPGRLLIYLAAIGGFYFTAGALLLGGIAQLPPPPLPDEQFLHWAALIAGGTLIVLSHLLDPATRRFRRSSPTGPGSKTAVRLSSWRRTAMGGDGGSGRQLATLAGLAFAAGAAELATMLSYLGAIGMLAASGLPTVTSAAVLAGYCVVMLLPALLLLGARLIWVDRLRGPLEQFDGWCTRHAGSVTAWILGVLGVALIAHRVHAMFPG